MLLPFLPRQVPGAPPSAPGINSDDALTINTQEASTASDLVIDPSATPGAGPTTAPQLAPSRTPVVTVSPTLDSSPSSPSSSSADPDTDLSTNVSTSSAPHSIALSTVIGSCVGAFIGAVVFICLGLWFYRRYSRSLKKYGSPRGPINARADLQRRRSHREPWDKLDDSSSDDKWVGGGVGVGVGGASTGNNSNNSTGYAGVGVNKQNSGRSVASKNTTSQESDEVPPMEKFTMFKKTLSIRTTYTTSTEPLEMSYPISSMPKAQPHTPVIVSSTQNGPASIPNINTTNTSTSTADISKPFLPHPQFSLDESSSFAISHSSRSQSYTADGSMAIPTPPATASPLHRWESAEIIHVDGQTAEILQNAVNPFADDANVKVPKGKENERDGESNRRSSGGNPFFGGHGEGDMLTKKQSRSRAGSVVSSKSRNNSVSVPSPPAFRMRSESSSTGKGKGRSALGGSSGEPTSDPFSDENVAAAKEKPVIPSITTTNWSNGGGPNAGFSTTTSSPLSPLKTPQPTFMHHIPTDSNEEQALASIIAALGDPNSEEAKLRIASMQSSIGSVYTVGADGLRESYAAPDAAAAAAYSYGMEERESRDVTREFPLPPASPGVAVGMGMPVGDTLVPGDRIPEDSDRASYLSYA